jgi:hypothetical protein
MLSPVHVPWRYRGLAVLAIMNQTSGADIACRHAAMKWSQQLLTASVAGDTQVAPNIEALQVSHTGG